MRAIITVNNEKVAKTDFPVIPMIGTSVKIRSGKVFKIEDIIFVESTDTSEMDYIGHIQLECSEK